MPALLTTNQIRDQCINEIFGTLEPNMTSSTILKNLPAIILWIEKNYNHLSGANRKAIVLSILNDLLDKFVKNEADRDVLKQCASTMIDAMVYMANNTEFLKKTERCCMSVWKKK